jgi:hypothetical protein
MAREGGAMVFFFFHMLKGDGRGRGFIYFRVYLIPRFFLTKKKKNPKPIPPLNSTQLCFFFLKVLNG